LGPNLQFFSFAMITFACSLWAAFTRRPHVLRRYLPGRVRALPPAHLVIRVIYLANTSQSMAACYLFDSNGQQMKT
jgi:hypothetical protein